MRINKGKSQNRTFWVEKNELLLNKLCDTSNSKLVVVHGRRRIVDILPIAKARGF